MATLVIVAIAGDNANPAGFRKEESPQVRANRQTAIAFAQYIATMQHMSATLIAQAKEVRDDGTIVEIVVWELDELLADFERNVANWSKT